MEKFRLMRYLILSILALSLSSCQMVPQKVKPTPFAPAHQASFVDGDAKMELLWDKGTFTEGPAIDKNNVVYFTDIPNSRIMKYSKSGKHKGIQVFRQGTGRANGLFFTPNQDMLICEGGNRRVAKLTMDGQYQVLANHYEGKKFNSPNDLVVAPNGDIYFTDPRYGNRDNMELDFEGVYVIRDFKVTLATKALNRPNGILVSQDGKWAYVADNNPGAERNLSRFPILEDGTFGEQEKLYVFEGNARGIDGMDMDTEGNLYATAGSGAASGIYIFSPEGEHLALIPVPDKPTNCKFGVGADSNVLYITAQAKRQPHEQKGFALFKIKTLKKGYALK